MIAPLTATCVPVPVRAPARPSATMSRDRREVRRPTDHGSAVRGQYSLERDTGVCGAAGDGYNSLGRSYWIKVDAP